MRMAGGTTRLTWCNPMRGDPELSLWEVECFFSHMKGMKTIQKPAASVICVRF
jgi:hypothetical protein